MEDLRGPAHRAAVMAAMLAAGALVAQQVAGKATRDALFLSSFPVSFLPAAMILSAVASAVSVLAFSAALSRRSPARVVPAAVGAATVLLLGEWALSVVQPRLAAAAVYLHMAVFGATVASGFWSLISERFDPYTARRVMGRLGLGASLGGVLGGLLAWSAAGLMPVPAMLVLMAVFNVVCLLGLARLRSTGPAAGPASGETAGALSGFRLLAETPYLRQLGLVVALGAATEAVLDYLLSAQAVATVPAGQPLMSFFALFHTSVGLLALAAQVLLSRWCLTRLGLAGTVALRPAGVVAAGVVALVDPRLWTAVMARGIHGVLHNSLFRSGYELLYTPLPEQRKRPTKTIVDVGFDRLGSVAGGALTLVLAAPPLGGPRLLFGVAVAGALGALALSRRLHLGYVAALEESLRSGAVRLDTGEVKDSTTLLTLARSGRIPDLHTGLAALRRDMAASTASAGDALLETAAGLRSESPEAARLALRRTDELAPALVGHVIPLLAREDLFLEALRVLRRAAPRCTGQLLDALLDPSRDADVRRRVPRALRGCPTQRAADGLLQGLGDPLFEVRRECALTLARLRQREPALSIPGPPIFASVVRELEEPPGERGLAHVFTLLSLVLERQPLEIAYWAVRGDDAALHGTALEYLENVLPEGVRDALWPHVRPRRRSGAPRPAEAVIGELLRAGETMAVRRRG
jgi:ATP:ADP antiporter, AAA family